VGVECRMQCMKNVTTFTVPDVLCSAYARAWARILRLFFLDIVEKTNLTAISFEGGRLPPFSQEGMRCR